MRLSNLKPGPWAAFFLVLVPGLILTTVLYNSSKLDKRTPPDETLTERHKQMIGAVTEMSKWLIGLASGTLVGLVGLRMGSSENDNSAWIERIPDVAYAFLLLSLYGGFLAYQATADILRIGPLDNFYGDEYKFPVLLQFWTLVVALVLIAMRLFSKKHVLLKAIAILIIGGVAAHATDNKEFSEKECAREWFKEQFNAENQDVASVIDLLNKVQKRSKIGPLNSCVDESAALDEIRFSSVQEGAHDTLLEFENYVASLNLELSSPNAATSSIIASIIKLLSPWDSSFEVLNVKASKGTCSILLNGSEIGFTNWIRRIKPGVYRLTVVRNHNTIYSSTDLRIVTGQPVTIDVDGTK